MVLTDRLSNHLSDLRKIELFKERGWGLGHQKGREAQHQGDFGLVMAAPRNWSFILICNHWWETFVFSRSGGLSWWICNVEGSDQVP